MSFAYTNPEIERAVMEAQIANWLAGAKYVIFDKPEWETEARRRADLKPIKEARRASPETPVLGLPQPAPRGWVVRWATALEKMRRVATPPSAELVNALRGVPNNDDCATARVFNRILGRVPKNTPIPLDTPRGLLVLVRQAYGSWVCLSVDKKQVQSLVYWDHEGVAVRLVIGTDEPMAISLLHYMERM